MAGKPSIRGRMGVEDGRHGEQDRAEGSRGGGGAGRRGWGAKPDDGEIHSVGGPDSKSGGRGTSGNPLTTSARNEHGDNPPNTVPMPIVGRGSSTPGGYRNTGDKLGLRGSLGNTRQAAYNEHPGHEGGSGNVLAREESNFYNELGRGKNDGEGDSGTGVDTYDRHIQGFGSGRDTFAETSNFYNKVGEDHESDAEANSGSGKIVSGIGGGKPKGVRGFSADTGEIRGLI